MEIKEFFSIGLLCNNPQEPDFQEIDLALMGIIESMTNESMDDYQSSLERLVTQTVYIMCCSCSELQLDSVKAALVVEDHDVIEDVKWLRYYICCLAVLNDLLERNKIECMKEKVDDFVELVSRVIANKIVRIHVVN